MQTTSVPALIQAARSSRDQTALLAFTAHGPRRSGTPAWAVATGS